MMLGPANSHLNQHIKADRDSLTHETRSVAQADQINNETKFRYQLKRDQIGIDSLARRPYQNDAKIFFNGRPIGATARTSRSCCATLSLFTRFLSFQAAPIMSNR